MNKNTCIYCGGDLGYYSGICIRCNYHPHQSEPKLWKSSQDLIREVVSDKMIRCKECDDTGSKWYGFNEMGPCDKCDNKKGYTPSERRVSDSLNNMTEKDKFINNILTNYKKLTWVQGQTKLGSYDIHIFSGMDRNETLYTITVSENGKHIFTGYDNRLETIYPYIMRQREQEELSKINKLFEELK